jgi:hypothetical protein
VRSLLPPSSFASGMALSRAGAPRDAGRRYEGIMQRGIGATGGRNRKERGSRFGVSLRIPNRESRIPLAVWLQDGFYYCGMYHEIYLYIYMQFLQNEPWVLLI